MVATDQSPTVYIQLTSNSSLAWFFVPGWGRHLIYSKLVQHSQVCWEEVGRTQVHLCEHHHWEKSEKNQQHLTLLLHFRKHDNALKFLGWMKRSYLLNLRLYKYQINKLRLSGSSYIYICAQSLPKLKLVIIDGLDYDVGMEELRRNNLGRENSFPVSELKTGFGGLEVFFCIIWKVWSKY